MNHFSVLDSKNSRLCLEFLKFFAITRTFFLTVRQNNFGNKIPYIVHSSTLWKSKSKPSAPIKPFSILSEFLLNQMTLEFFWTSPRIRMLNLTKISFSTGGTGIFQELRSEFSSQKQLTSPLVQIKKNRQNASVHCAVYCTKAYHHHGYMYFQQQQRTQHQPKRSKYGKR